MARLRALDDDVKDHEEDKMFEDFMTRAYTGQAFREFYKQHLTQFKYELKTSNVRLLHFMSQRGQQRIMQKKKYKALGELSVIEKMLNLIDVNKKEHV